MGMSQEITMTWEIVLGIISLVTFVGIIIGWTSKIAGTLSKLSASVDNLNNTIKEFKNDQAAIIEHVSHHDVILAKHDEQIKNLETRIDSDK